MQLSFTTHRSDRAIPAAKRRARMKSVWSLSLMAIVLATAGCQRDETPKTTATATPTPARAPFEASLTLANNSGRIDYSGTVDAAATRTVLENTLRAVYDGDRANGAIDIDDAAKPADWTTGLDPLLRAFAPAYGAALRFEGDRIVLTGLADEALRAQLRDAARQAFPNAKLEGLLADSQTNPELQAIAQSPGSGRGPDAEKLALALNQMPVRFDAGKGNVSEDSLALVAQAAQAIRAAPEGTRLLIVGPVAASKDAGNDIFLSKQRAEALKAQLILSGVNPGVIETRGWGQNPDGTTTEGTTPPTEGAPMRFELLPAS
jgi:outer membrane protein OmpA-like peptidoglycan-associated protein